MKKKKKSPPRQNSAELMDALAPAAGHLAAAVVEFVAAASTALEALGDDRVASRLPGDARRSLASARASLELFASMAATGAEQARRRARESVRTEALAEILAALDARAERLEGPARKALDAVREAVAGASRPGANSSRNGSQTRSSTRSKAPARQTRVMRKPRRMKKIPIVLDRDPSEE